jgi:hypothetical protein
MLYYSTISNPTLLHGNSPIRVLPIDVKAYKEFFLARTARRITKIDPSTPRPRHELPRLRIPTSDPTRREFYDIFFPLRQYDGYLSYGQLQLVVCGGASILRSQGDLGIEFALFARG